MRKSFPLRPVSINGASGACDDRRFRSARTRSTSFDGIKDVSIPPASRQHRQEIIDDLRFYEEIAPLGFHDRPRSQQRRLKLCSDGAGGADKSEGFFFAIPKGILYCQASQIALVGNPEVAAIFLGVNVDS
ncbi:hypothetical protein ACDY97_22040 [Rhizobium mongolense]|uniref:hypothetical protein n=1 Tax=Rhizobium TaxID=379 RepID=UPI0024B0D0EC|nr:hypothetical protein [Rhizobium sp. CC1099]WFU89929.1 hypothetical protein QA644_28215 [Rhizobium sp. CC1099]